MLIVFSTLSKYQKGTLTPKDKYLQFEERVEHFQVVLPSTGSIKYNLILIFLK